jgi:hypothetical protein
LSEVPQIITDLLCTAKVAMPGKLYAEDPRVIRAQAWLDEHASADANAAEIIRRLVEAAENGARKVPGRVPAVPRRGT